MQIKQIKISGNLHIPENELHEKLLVAALKKPLAKYLGQTHMLLWGSAEVSDPLIEKITLHRDWLKQEIDVTVQEHERFAVWCEEQDCFWISKNGQALEKAPISDGQLVNIIYSNQKIDLKPGINIMPNEEILYLKTILSSVRDLNISISKI